MLEDFILIQISCLRWRFDNGDFVVRRLLHFIGVLLGWIVVECHFDSAITQKMRHLGAFRSIARH